MSPTPKIPVPLITKQFDRIKTLPHLRIVNKWWRRMKLPPQDTLRLDLVPHRSTLYSKGIVQRKSSPRPKKRNPLKLKYPRPLPRGNQLKIIVICGLENIFGWETRSSRERYRRTDSEGKILGFAFPCLTNQIVTSILSFTFELVDSFYILISMTSGSKYSSL